MKTKELLNALTIVKPAIGGNDMNDLGTSFAFAEGHVIAFNEEIQIMHPITDFEIEGVVKAEELYKFLNRIDAEDIKFAVKNEGELVLKAGRSRAGIKIDKNIPSINTKPENSTKAWKELPENFVDMIKFVSVAASDDASTPALTCVHVREDGIIESSDRYRICRYETDSFTEPFLLPKNVVSSIINIKPTQMSLKDNWIHFKNEEGSVLSAKIFDAKFPDLDQHFEDEDGTEIQFPDNLEKIIDKANIFAKRDYFFDQYIKVTLKENKMIIRSESEYGWFEESAKIDYDQEPFQFNIIPKILEDIIKDNVQSIMLFDNKIMFVGEDWKYIASISKSE